MEPLISRREREAERNEKFKAFITARIIEIENQIKEAGTRLNNGIEYAISPKQEIAELARLLDINRAMIRESEETCH